MIEFNFEELDVYKEARAFKKRIYKLSDLLPEEERYRLRFQMRKAGLSMTNCIAEGHGRYTFKDRLHFFVESRGSVEELVDDINDCHDNGYAKAEHLENLRSDAERVHKLINGYIRYLRKEAKSQTDKKKKRPPPP
jgi:four helix bundle protein